jgi:putative component of membrane protein insertase Oxa1/YidC/SpoIIIJ protein YidD
MRNQMDKYIGKLEKVGRGRHKLHKDQIMKELKKECPSIPLCPDYNDKCITMLGVVTCCQVTHKNKVRCQAMSYGDEEEERL